jgi:putative redox protein
MTREVVVSADVEAGRYVQRIEAGEHRLVADEPPPAGSDLGPDPYALLLASLGACTSMTLRMFAARKAWPLEGVSVRLQYNRIHAKDCEECEQSTGWVHRFEVDVEVEGDLSDEQRGRLLEIAERCPVHRTLVDEKQILTRLTG